MSTPAQVRAAARLPLAARDAILAWYADRGRPLAFRRTSDPYAILVSEAMAQQTQAARAAAYWERFMDRFPTVEVLAAATPADVLRAWAGLGYDRRAVALWRTARVIVASHGGRVPSDLADLAALPGVGPYTARAVAALAYGLPVGAVDVNVRRVLGRIVTGETDALSAAAVQAVADAAVPADQPGTWTHAVMDVGATVCKPSTPSCPDCPARPWCRYAAGGHATDRRSNAHDSRDGRAAPIERAVRERPVRERPVPFAATNRWLRGRILDRLRAAPDGAWVAFDGKIGAHDHDRVMEAVTAMAKDGVAELESRADGLIHARLPLS